MATKSAQQHRSKTAASKTKSKRASKREPVLVTRTTKAEGKSKGREWQTAFLQRDKKFAQHFGPTFPKGKLIAKDGSLATPAVASRDGIFIAQYAPTPERMSWMYVSHGLSQASLEKGGKSGAVELILHLRDRQPEVAAGVMHAIMDYAINQGIALNCGELISGDNLKKVPSTGFAHWLACAPEKALTEKLSADKLNMIMLIGVSDAEMQVAMKVNPQAADGRKVLIEALKVGGVFPVTDSTRNCLTRRRDFHRLWESAFHAVREQAKL